MGTSYFIVRLGADSEKEIRRIDGFRALSTDSFLIDIPCRQVPKGLSVSDVAILWLGTNNNKGGKTPWTQGIRAVGRIQSVIGSGGYSATKVVTVEIGVVLPASVTKMDIVKQQSKLYPDIAAMPVLGVNNYSSQVVQRIDHSEPGQSLPALLRALEGISPGVERTIRSTYPDLVNLFDEPAPVPEYVEIGPDEEIPHWGSEDDDGLEKEEDRELEIEVPFDPTKIDIIAKPMTISSLEDRLDNYELDLTPDFQRQANVWDAKRKTRLIESILLKIPLPSFYFSEDTNGGYAVVDGLQRLCAVFHFKNAKLLNKTTGADLAPLRLKGLQYLKELEGRTFLDLDRKFQRRIAELEITANIIRANTPSAVKFNVFARLNQGGMPLNAQEIRNAIFPGEWRNELRRLAESQSFLDATGGKVHTSRQQDMELVLRFVGLWQLKPPYRRPSNQTLDEFLNATVEHEICRWNAEQWKGAGDAFFRAIRATCKVLGEQSFRKSVGTPQRRPINRSLFEAELIVFGALSDSALSQAVARKSEIEVRLAEAIANDKAFSRALLYGTGSAEASHARVSVLTRLVSEVTSA